MANEPLGAGFGEEGLPIIASHTLTGDLTAIIVGELKSHPDKWERMTEKQQGQAIERISAKVEHAAKRATTLIAAHNRASVRAAIESCAVKDKLKIVLTVPLSSPDRHAIIDATGEEVLLVLPDFAAHIGGEKPTAEPDQPGLPLGEPGPVDCTTCGDAGEVSDPEAGGAMVTCPACGGGLAKDGATVTGDGTGEALPGIEGEAATIEGSGDPADLTSRLAFEVLPDELPDAELPDAEPSFDEAPGAEPAATFE